MQSIITNEPVALALMQKAWDTHITAEEIEQDADEPTKKEGIVKLQAALAELDKAQETDPLALLLVQYKTGSSYTPLSGIRAMIYLTLGFLLEENDPASAIAMLRESAVNSPELDAPFYVMGRIFLKYQYRYEAMHCFKEALRRYPDDEDYQAYLAEAVASTARNQNELMPGSVALPIPIPTATIVAQDAIKDSLETLYTISLRLDADAANPFHGYTKDFSEHVTAIGRAIDSVNLAFATDNTAIFKVENGKWHSCASTKSSCLCLLAMINPRKDGALENLREAIALNPTNVGTIATLANFYNSAGCKSEAVQTITWALTLAPEDDECKETLAALS